MSGTADRDHDGDLSPHARRPTPDPPPCLRRRQRRHHDGPCTRRRVVDVRPRPSWWLRPLRRRHVLGGDATAGLDDLPHADVLAEQVVLLVEPHAALEQGTAPAYDVGVAGHVHGELRGAGEGAETPLGRGAADGGDREGDPGDHAVGGVGPGCVVGPGCGVGHVPALEGHRPGRCARDASCGSAGRPRSPGNTRRAGHRGRRVRRPGMTRTPGASSRRVRCRVCAGSRRPPRGRRAGPCRRSPAPRGRTRRRRPRPGQRLGGGVRQDLQEDLVVHLGEVEHADAVGDRGAARAVPVVQGGLLATRQVAQERGAVVAREVVERHRRPTRPGRAADRVRRSGSSRPSSRSSAVWHGARAHPELHHRERHVGLDPDDDVTAPRSRAISAMLRSVRDPKRVEHVEGGDIDDDPAGPVPADLVDQVVLEPDHLGVVQGSVDRRDQVASPAAGSRPAPVRCSRRRRHRPCGSPCSRAAARPPRGRPAGRRWCSSC